MLIVTFQLEHEAVALERTLQRVAGITLEAERIAAHSTQWTMPCLWVTNGDFDDVDTALANDPSVAEIVEKYEFESEKYYQVEWAEAVKNRIDRYVDKEASILTARAGSNGWQLQIRFVGRDQFEEFREYLDGHGLSYRLVDITEPGAPRQSYGRITPAQRNALVTAMERGYYQVPRGVTARELADDLGTSHQAVSELLRRGTENLVESLLTTSGEFTQE